MLRKNGQTLFIYQSTQHKRVCCKITGSSRMESRECCWPAESNGEEHCQKGTLYPILVVGGGFQGEIISRTLRDQSETWGPGASFDIQVVARLETHLKIHPQPPVCVGKNSKTTNNHGIRFKLAKVGYLGYFMHFERKIGNIGVQVLVFDIQSLLGLRCPTVFHAFLYIAAQTVILER